MLVQGRELHAKDSKRSVGTFYNLVLTLPESCDNFLKGIGVATMAYPLL